jgi:hypothetical protein
MDDRIVAVAAGANHRLALAESGRVYSWGTSQATGQGVVETPRAIETLIDNPMCAVFAYHNSSFFLDSQSRVWCCGTNSSGSLGLGHIDDVPTPILQEFSFDAEQIIQIACGDDFTLYLTAGGNVWASGNGGDHRNATGSNETRIRPALASRLTGRFISQIAVGCFNSAFLENGCPPFNHMTQFRGDFEDYPVPSFPFRATAGNRMGIEIDPSPSALLSFGFLLNDIIQYDDKENAKVIGASQNCVAVIRQSKNQICLLDQMDKMDLLRRYQLIKRENSNLRTVNLPDGSSIVVDACPSETLRLGGFLAGDIVKVDSVESQLEVAGVRIGLIWAIDRAGRAYSFPDSKVKIIKRNACRVRQMETMDGRAYVVQESKKSGNGLVFYDDYGLGFYIGRIGKQYVYSFVCSTRRILILDHKLPLVRVFEGSAQTEVTTKQWETVNLETTCSATSLLGFFKYDRICYGARQYGTVLGVCGDKLGVRGDCDLIEDGLIELVSPDNAFLIGRISKEGVRLCPKGVSYSVNTNDFEKSRFLPGDRIRDGSKRRGVVFGVRSRDIFALWDGEKELKAIDESPTLIASYIEADAREKYNGELTVDVALMHCALNHMKPGDRRKGRDGRIVWYLGFDCKNRLWFEDVQSGELREMSLCELDPEYFEPDRF